MRHATTRLFSSSSLRLRPATAGLAPFLIFLFASLRYLPLPRFLAPSPYAPGSEGLRKNVFVVLIFLEQIW